MVCGHVGHLFAPLGVVQLEGGALGLQLDLVFQLLAGDALVHETVAALVDLQEGGHAHAAAHVVGHRCVEILHLCADPCAHAQAVAGLHGLALHVNAQHTHGTHVGDLLLIQTVGGYQPLEALSWMYLLSFCASRMITPVTRPSLSFSSLVPKQPKKVCAPFSTALFRLASTIKPC